MRCFPTGTEGGERGKQEGVRPLQSSQGGHRDGAEPILGEDLKINSKGDGRRNRAIAGEGREK